MANEQKSIFTKKAQDKLRSPDELDEYVRLTNPSVWVVLAACVLLMMGLLAWAFFGTLTTSVTTMGTYVDDEVVCFLTADSASKVKVGDIANVEGVLLEVTSVSAVPLSREEAREIVGGDYLASTLIQSDWVYVVRFVCDEDPGFNGGVPLSINITTEKIAPISLVLKDAA